MENIEQYLDYTNLKSTATRKEIARMVDDCIKYNFIGLCIAPCWVSFAKNRLKQKGNTSVKIVTVPNWKMGGGLIECEGITDLVCELADEVDYIWNCYEFGDLKDWERTKKELKTIREKTKGELKIIIEAWYLRKMDEKIHKVGIEKVIKQACELVNESGADWIKTDSGLFHRPDFDTHYEDCQHLLKYSRLPIKAAGGITTKYQAEKLIDLGVRRIGSSKAIDIISSDL